MPDIRTASAQANSLPDTGRMFSSMNRTSHSQGTIAAMRRIPCGGMKALTGPIRGNA